MRFSQALATSHVAAYPMTDYAATAAIELAAAATAAEQRRGERGLRSMEEEDEEDEEDEEVVVVVPEEGDADSGGMMLTPHLRKALSAAAFYQEPHEQHNHDQHHHHPDAHHHVQEEDAEEHEDVVAPQFQFYQPDSASAHLGASDDPDGVASSREGLNGHDPYDPSDQAYSQAPIALSTEHHPHGSQTPEPRTPSSVPNSPHHKPRQYQQPEGTPVSTVEKARQRRELHKEVERRRREGINEGISALVAVVPGCEKNKRAILDRAAAYVRELQDRAEQERAANLELRAQLEEERRKYEELRRETDSYAAERVRLQRDNVALRKRMTDGLSSLQRVGSALIQNLAPAEAEALSAALAAGLAEEDAAAAAVADRRPSLYEGQEDEPAHARKKARTGA